MMLSTQHRKRAIIKRTSGVTIEKLELRTMMANTGGMDTNLVQHYQAPPAIVEYFNPATDLNGGSDNNPPTDAGENTESRSLGIYNTTFSGLNFGRNAYWAGVAAWNSATWGVFDTSRAKVESIAKIARDGGKAIWTQKPIAAGSMTILDFETATLENRSPAFIADRLRWFKAAAPNVKVGMYGWVMHTLNRQAQSRWNAADQARFESDVMKRREAILAADFICMDFYLLGHGGETLDITATRNIVNGYRRLFPDKPIVPFIWGSYHNSWNPKNDVFSDEVNEQYVQACRELFDGVMVWGPREDNTKLITSLYKAGNAVLPTDRKPTWASEVTVTGPTSDPTDDDPGLDPIEDPIGKEIVP